jgi:hypothetical protein
MYTYYLDCSHFGAHTRRSAHAGRVATTSFDMRGGKQSSTIMENMLLLLLLLLLLLAGWWYRWGRQPSCTHAWRHMRVRWHAQARQHTRAARHIYISFAASDDVMQLLSAVGAAAPQPHRSYLAAQGERGGQSVDRPASWICIKLRLFVRLLNASLRKGLENSLLMVLPCSTAKLLLFHTCALVSVV